MLGHDLPRIVFCHRHVPEFYTDLEAGDRHAFLVEQRHLALQSSTVSECLNCLLDASSASLLRRNGFTRNLKPTTGTVTLNTPYLEDSDGQREHCA